MTDKATIEARVPRKGLQSGALREYTIVGKVKPGHEKAVRDALTSHLTDPRRADVEILKKVGIHTALHALFDNDTRLVATVWFENDFDKYFDDVMTIIGVDLYKSWLQHLEGFPEKGLLGGLSGQAGMEFGKNWLAQNEAEVTQFPSLVSTHDDCGAGENSALGEGVPEGARSPRCRTGAQASCVEAVARRSGGLSSAAARAFARTSHNARTS